MCTFFAECLPLVACYTPLYLSKTRLFAANCRQKKTITATKSYSFESALLVEFIALLGLLHDLKVCCKNSMGRNTCRLAA